MITFMTIISQSCIIVYGPSLFYHNLSVQKNESFQGKVSDSNLNILRGYIGNTQTIDLWVLLDPMFLKFILYGGNKRMDSQYLQNAQHKDCPFFKLKEYVAWVIESDPRI